MLHQRGGHTPPAIIRMDCQRCDLRLILVRAGYRVARDASAHLRYYEEVPAILVEFQEVFSGPGLRAETGALDAQDARQMAPPEGNDLDLARQTALAVERPQSM